MKGDFSRSTFDPSKHYTSVRMQQGRVQLDADWNEQADILLHLITTQLKDLLGPGGTAATDDGPGFAISLVEPAGAPPDEDQVAPPADEPAPSIRTLPDFQIGAGRYYVDGIPVENEAPVTFSEQPDYPDAASRLAEPVDHDRFLVYLDVWGRHITAVQDPAIRETALGGPDTTTRTQTVWQVKLLPLPGYAAAGDDWRERGGLRSRAGWEAFVNKAAGKGRLQATWDQDQGAFLENHLYRVEIHSVDDDQVTFKWSRENGSVVFPIRAVSGTLELNLEGLDRDTYQLQQGNWVEIVDDVTLLKGCSLPLCQVKDLDRPIGKVILQADEEGVKAITTEIGERELQHPLLRRWEDEAKPTTAQSSTPASQGETWLDLENGIQVAFSDTGSYQVGDYWLIPARTAGGIEWPQHEGQVLAQAPHGIAHHYAPLALLQFQAGGWSVEPDAAAAFRSLPQVSADVVATDGQLQSIVSDLRGVRADVTNLDERVTDLEEQKSRIQAHIFEDFTSVDALEVGHVVALDPHSEGHVALVGKENDRLVAGVVTELIDNQRCRVVLYGRVSCKVVGKVKPGDLLVPSDVPDYPGHARKAGWYLRPGTILGKALSSTKFNPEVVEEIEEGRRLDQIDMSRKPGTVDMLVTLG